MEVTVSPVDRANQTRGPSDIINMIDKSPSLKKKLKNRLAKDFYAGGFTGSTKEGNNRFLPTKERWYSLPRLKIIIDNVFLSCIVVSSLS